MLQNLDFDFSLFEDVPSPKSHNTVCRLTLAAEDRNSARTKPFTAPSRGPRPFGFKSVQMAVSSAWTPMAPAT